MERILERGKKSFIKTKFYMNHDLIIRLRSFLENEARSCSMEFGCVTPLYVYRMGGGPLAIEEIEAGFKEIQNGCR